VVLTVAGGEPIAVHADAPRMNAAIDAMIDKADKRLRRYRTSSASTGAKSRGRSPRRAEESRSSPTRT
jgi:ribosome-associated translation inhibitor RaiA